MLSWAVRCVAIMAAIIGGFVYVSSLDLGQGTGAPAAATHAPVTAKTAAVPAAVHASEMRIEAASNGHYFARAYANGVPVDFLIDTGASGIALSAEDAERIGLRPSRSDYTVRFETANGPKFAAPVSLRNISVGGFSSGEIPAFVSPKGAMGISLLGMSFLSRLDSYEVQRGTLVLRW